MIFFNLKQHAELLGMVKKISELKFSSFWKSHWKFEILSKIFQIISTKYFDCFNSLQKMETKFREKSFSSNPHSSQPAEIIADTKGNFYLFISY